MAKISEEKLREKLESGAVKITNLRDALASELNNMAIVTLPTVGAFNHDLNSREAEAREKISQLENDAEINVPILRKLILEQGASEGVGRCEECEKWFRNITANWQGIEMKNGNTCSTCKHGIGDRKMTYTIYPIGDMRSPGSYQSIGGYDLETESSFEIEAENDYAAIAEFEEFVNQLDNNWNCKMALAATTGERREIISTMKSPYYEKSA